MFGNFNRIAIRFGNIISYGEVKHKIVSSLLIITHLF